jgi:cation diffusion facilitator family transporter
MPGTETVNRRAAAISLGTNACLTLLKFAAAFLTGSISLLSEAFHSGTDVAASFLAFLSIRAAAAPPDEDHPYGHGKIESLAMFGEGVLLLGIVGLILFQSIANLVKGAHPDRLDLGMAVMGLSSISALGLGRFLLSTARKTGSPVLKSNGSHMLLDFWTSMGVLSALAVQRLTGFEQADAIFGILIGCWLAVGAWKLVNEAFQQIIDRRVTDEEVARIREILASTPDLISYHRLRTRHSGHVHYVDLHAVVPREWSVVRAHELADGLEKRICAALEPAQVVVHIDPFDPEKADA